MESNEAHYSVTDPQYKHMENPILKLKQESIINKKKRPGSKINMSPAREGVKSNTNWRILTVKIVCFIFVVVALLVAIAPFAGLVQYFTSSEVNTTGSINTQTERIDNKCAIINNSTLGFNGNRSYNLTLQCEHPYTSNGSLCVPLCGTWHPGGHTFRFASRFVACVAAALSLIGCLMGIFTWLKIGRKLFEFPQVIPFYLLICAAIQAISILVGQIQFEKFYCNHEDLIGSRQEPTVQCYIQGAFFHYASLVFVFWYLIYVVTVLLVLSFPFKLQIVNASWKIHLILFIVATATPLLILVIFWAIDDKRYEIVNLPVVCLPKPKAMVVTIVLPLALMQFLSLVSISLIISRLIINKIRLRNHKVSKNPFSNEQNQFIIRTLGVTIVFTFINLFLTLEFGTRVSFTNLYASYVELYWACVTRYGTNSSCCVNDYVQYYKPELTVISDFFFSSWGFVALSTFTVKDARNFWVDLFKRCLCFKSKSVDLKLEVGSSFQIGTLSRKLTGLFTLRSVDRENQEKKEISDSGIDIECESKSLGSNQQ